MKIGRKIYSAISSLVLLLILVLVVLLIGVRLIGYTPYAVLSGSMDPLYPTGSLVYVTEVEASDIEEGDVITFYMTDSSTVVTHQVIEIDEENGYYYTQGLANDTPDGSPVTIDRVIGEVVFGIAYLGYVATYITTPPWIYIAIALVLMWIIIVYMIDLWKKDKEDARRKN